MSNIPDAQLVTQAFQSHYGLVVAAAGSYAPTPDLVYDVVHQAFIDFMNTAMRGGWDPQNSPGPLLYEIAKNHAIDLWKKERMLTGENRLRLGERLMQMQRDRKDDPAAADRRLGALDECIQKLSPKAKEIIEKHYFGNMTLENLARQLSTPSGTLRKTLFRIRSKLRDCISRQLNEVDR